MSKQDDGCQCGAYYWGECACGKFDDGTDALRSENRELKAKLAKVEEFVNYYELDDLGGVAAELIYELRAIFGAKAGDAQ